VNSPRSALDLDAISDGLKAAHRFVPRLCCNVWHPSTTPRMRSDPLPETASRPRVGRRAVRLTRQGIRR
jgi:hypothetical protein